MKILFDQGTPVPLRHSFVGHIVSTAFEQGWSTLTNGELLDHAEKGFDVLITTDQNLEHQQNLANRQISILVLPTTSWIRLQSHAKGIVTMAVSMQPGEIQRFNLD
jgi:hypothetical protein